MSHECQCDTTALDAPRQSKYPMMNVQDALQLVIDTVQRDTRTGTVTVPLFNALHCTLATTITSTVDMPPFRASIMDGYGIYTDDNTTHINADYVVVGDVTAGVTDLVDVKLKLDECVYITTGAVVPTNINCVIMIESTTVVDSDNKRIHITSPCAVDMNIRPVGCDMKSGDTVLQQGTVLNAVDIGLLASLGKSDIGIVRQPVIGVFSSGNEIVDPATAPEGYPLQPGQIYDSNRPMLLTAVVEQHATPYDLGVVPDTDASITNVINTALRNQVDILLTTGGVSMGALDLIKPLLEKLGTVHFGRLNMKPGKPCTFATIQGKTKPLYVFALPGNPVSAYVTFQLFVAPAIKLLNGQSSRVDMHNHGSVWLQCKTVQPLKRDKIRPEYHRCILQYDSAANEFIALTTGNQLSSRLMSVQSANALLLVDAGDGAVSANTMCKALLFGPLMPFDARSVKTAAATTVSHTHQHNHQPKHTPAMSVASIHASDTDKFQIKVAVITVSDTVSQGNNTDVSGPLLCQHLLDANPKLKSAQYNVSPQLVVPDEQQQISDTLIKLCNDDVHLILTTGGTGFSPRDVTPEATAAVLHRTAPGIVTAMIQTGLQHTPMALLSRLAAGTRDRTVIVNLPGSPKAVAELMPMLSTTLPHAVRLMRQGKDDHNVKHTVK